MPWRWVRDEKGRVKTQTVEVTYCIDGRPTPTRVKRPLLEIFEPKKDSEVEGGTVARGSATCPVTGFTTKVESVRAQLKKRRGGAADARLFCIVTTREKEQGRFYRLPTKADQAAFDAAAAELTRRCQVDATQRTQRDAEEDRVDATQRTQRHAGEDRVDATQRTQRDAEEDREVDSYSLRSSASSAVKSPRLSLMPDEQISLNELRRVSVPIYGMERWGDLFSPRQALALTTLARLVREVSVRWARAITNRATSRTATGGSNATPDRTGVAPDCPEMATVGSGVSPSGPGSPPLHAGRSPVRPVVTPAHPGSPPDHPGMATAHTGKLPDDPETLATG